MKNRFKALLLCAATLIAAFTVSCKNQDKNDEVQQPVKSKVTNVYHTDFITLPENYSGGSGMFLYDGRIYMICTEILDQETFKNRSVLYSVDITGGDPQSETLVEPSQFTYLNKLAFEPDGSRVTLTSSWNEDTKINIYTLKKTAVDGTAIFEKNAAEFFDTASSTQQFYIQNLVTDSEGNIYLSNDTTLAVLDPDGGKLFEKIIDGHIQSLSSGAGGNVLINYYDYSSNYGQAVKPIDLTKKDFGEAVDVPESLGRNNVNIYTGPGYDYYFKNDIGVYGYDAGSEQPTPLLNWINSDITGVSDLLIIDADHFAYSGYDRITGKQQLAFLTRVPDDEVTEKYIINLAYFNNGSGDLASYVVKFNQSSDIYRVVLNDYSQYNTSEDYLLGSKTLANEITAGKVPDIIMVGNGSFEEQYASLAEKGLFADLYTYLDGDPDVGREDILKCLQKPFEVNGKLCRLVTNFSVNTLAIKTANLPSGTSWKVEDMLAMAKNAGDGVKLFEYMTKANMLNILCSRGASQFIDSATGECSFDGETFIGLLEYCNTLPAEWDYGGYEQKADQFAGYRDNKMLLHNVYLRGFSAYLQERFVFGFEPITLIGYPGSGGAGASINVQASYAFAEKSAVKDGAWQFLRSLIIPVDSDSQTGMMNYRWDFPATYKDLQSQAEEEMKQYYFFRYSGGWSSSSSPVSEEEMNQRGGGLAGQLTQEDVDNVIAYLDSLADSASGGYSYDTTISGIITEESAYYFDGTKTAEETAKVIQSRISIYISESQ